MRRLLLSWTSIIVSVLAVVMLSAFWILRAEERENQVRMNTICGADERKQDDGIPVARVYFNERQEALCTAWIAPNGWMVTAGHCTSGYYRFDEVQFQVPSSKCDGTIQNPDASFRFAVDRSSIQHRVDLPTTQDWAIFRIHPDSEMPDEFKNGAFFRISNVKIPKDANRNLKNTGFGVELRSFEGCKNRNRTMQTSEAKAYNSPGYLIHFADTHMGSSGSPLYQDRQGDLFAYGTHRGGGCPNIATSVLNPGFLKALSRAWGKPTVFVDWKGSLSGEATGGIEAPFRALQPALDQVKRDQEISIAPGRYNVKDLRIPDRPFRIRAPFGSISIQQNSGEHQ